MSYTYENYDIAVIGAGHAGCEAALACARLGLKTIVFTVNVESIALMPCNPNIGGSSKGHLVREIDALGGQMGKTIDQTFIQSKMLNKSKGPAVHSLRAQADKHDYTEFMRRTLESQENLTVKRGYIDRRWTCIRGSYPYRWNLSMQSGNSGYRCLFESQMSVWRIDYLYRPKWTSGCDSSFRQFKTPWN